MTHVLFQLHSSAAISIAERRYFDSPKSVDFAKMSLDGIDRLIRTEGKGRFASLRTQIILFSKLRRIIIGRSTNVCLSYFCLHFQEPYNDVRSKKADLKRFFLKNIF